MIARGEFDYVYAALVTGVVANILLLAAVIVLTVHNSTSRNLALGVGALVGVSFAFWTQVWFDLRSTAKVEHISFSYTFDLAEKTLRQWNYSDDRSTDLLDARFIGPRMGTEIEAGKWIFSANQEIVATDRKKVVTDFTLLSLISFFGQVEHDWQWLVRRYRSSTLGHGSIMPLSKDEECAYIEEAVLRASMERAGNVFAQVPGKIILPPKGICLPRGTSLQIEARRIVLRNSVVELEIEIEEPEWGAYLQPGTGDVPLLKTGKPRFETFARALVVRTTFLALRAGNRQRSEFERWSDRVFQNLSKWFACC